ncbi:histidine kinase [Thermosipho melanesiensis]|uniref:histidine kinase n=2 Tax=Thermosipho melanesiensis TaxID=46541 RepID=A6LLH5_THEM4|nr:ATP-binding protein [Thermosipho melanesiensis]ABR30776.1 histidine kinase [Thermosipho melanesiensis BI429]APT73899.1 histidine kinase [Thermosipho melanesiensis]OOC35838.1 histidine kinase [Thermosipho melanesiensis]OOC38340.1 histidine kinase [Thermosipho melanesiensis]OOC38801.1 histidine kinase [Thermosipho melanesiensis]
MGLLTIADHVQDITENSIKAGAKNVILEIYETDKEFTFVVRDDGPGIKDLNEVFDPFYTSRDKKIRRFGLGLPFLKQAVEMTGGSVDIKTKLGEGTTVKATFIKEHIDCQPVGDLITVFLSLLMNENVNLKIKRCRGKDCYEISSQVVKEYLGDLNSPGKIKILKEMILELEGKEA